MRNDLQDEAIDIFALIRALWAKKWLIVGIAVLVTSAVSLYAFKLKPVYEAKILTLPPTESGLVALNSGRGPGTDLNPYKVKDVSDVFGHKLMDESQRRAFFNEVFFPRLSDEEKKAPKDRLYQHFSRQLTVLVLGKDQDRYSISFRGSSPTEASYWVRAYVDRADSESKKEIITNASGEAQMNIRDISEQINRLREAAIGQREDQILILGEALNIAKMINLKRPLVSSGNTVAEVRTGADGPALYMRGSEAIEAEIRNLKQRVSDDPFIAGLRPLQAKLSSLNHVAIDESKVSVYRQDGAVYVPDSRISSKRGLFIAMGGILGLMLGALTVSALYFLGKHRR